MLTSTWYAGYTYVMGVRLVGTLVQDWPDDLRLLATGISTVYFHTTYNNSHTRTLTTKIQRIDNQPLAGNGIAGQL